MKKKGFLIILLVIIAGLAGYYYHKNTQPHYIITATEKVLKGTGLVPSSLNVTEATFYTEEGQGTALIKYIYKNQYGADKDGYVILEFTAPPVEDPSEGAFAKHRYDSFKKNQELVKNGKLKIEPFSTMKFKSAILDERPLTEAQNLLLRSELLLQSHNYKGPSLGGVVTELNEDGSHKYDFPVLEYKPNEFFPYKRDR